MNPLNALLSIFDVLFVCSGHFSSDDAKEDMFLRNSHLVLALNSLLCFNVKNVSSISSLLGDLLLDLLPLYHAVTTTLIPFCHIDDLAVSLPYEHRLSGFTTRYSASKNCAIRMNLEISFTSFENRSEPYYSWKY